MSDAITLETLTKQRERYAQELQITAINQQRLQGALAVLDKLIEAATPGAGKEPKVEQDEAA